MFGRGHPEQAEYEEEADPPGEEGAGGWAAVYQVGH
jgi:hypothetical protein